MTRDALLSQICEFQQRLQAAGATAVYLYGSRARGDARGDSDVDLFIEYDPSTQIPNLFQIVEIEGDIARTLGLSVSITTRQSLHPAMRGAIEHDAVRVM